jgi:hypothetical protein
MFVFVTDRAAPRDPNLRGATASENRDFTPVVTPAEFHVMSMIVPDAVREPEPRNGARRTAGLRGRKPITTSQSVVLAVVSTAASTGSGADTLSDGARPTPLRERAKAKAVHCACPVQQRRSEGIV